MSNCFRNIPVNVFHNGFLASPQKNSDSNWKNIMGLSSSWLIYKPQFFLRLPPAENVDQPVAPGLWFSVGNVRFTIWMYVGWMQIHESSTLFY